MIMQPDLLLYTAFQVGLADMRKNEFLLDDAYCQLVKDPLLQKLYGQKEIDRFKAFIRKEIFIFTEHRTPDLATFPCIVIKIGEGNEDAPKDALGDSFQSEKVDPSTLGGAFSSSHTIIGPLTPMSFDYLTGIITFNDDVNLSKSGVFETHFVYDSVNDKSYPIQLVLDSSNLMIEPGMQPVLTNMSILRAPLSYGHVRRSIWFYETHGIDLYSSDANELLYLFTIVLYILGRYKRPLFEARNFAVGTISYGPIERASPSNDPNNVYVRSMSIRGRVEQSFIESTTPLIQGFDLGLKIADMSTPASFLEEVENQSWDGENDP